MHSVGYEYYFLPVRLPASGKEADILLRMNQSLEGVAQVVRVIRSSLGIVALGMVIPVIFSLAIFLFAPIPNIAKYVIGGLPWLLVLLVWLQFWSKAKDEPLPASETYHIEVARYRYMATERNPLTSEELHGRRLSQRNPDPFEVPPTSPEETREEGCST